MLPRAEADRPAPAAEPRRQRIVEVFDDHRVRIAQHAALRRDVVVEALVAVHVVGADVQHRRRGRAQRIGRLELEARKLQDVQLAVAPEQRQRGRAQVPPGPDPHSRAPRHLREKRRDGALPVGAGDRDDRRIGRAGEELDVAGDRHAARRRGPQRRLPDRNPRAHDDLRGGAEQRGVEPAATDLHAGELRLDRRAARRALARVHRDHAPPDPREMADARQPRLAEADDEHVPGRAVVKGVMGHGTGAHGPFTGSSGWPAPPGPAPP